MIIPFKFPYYEPAGISFAPSEISYDTILSLSFAGSFVWVMFSYSGWNASTYIVMNLDQPKKNLPFSLIKGTVLVTIIYILLNMTFMYVATFDELAGEIGQFLIDTINMALAEDIIDEDEKQYFIGYGRLRPHSNNNKLKLFLRLFKMNQHVSVNQ